MMIKPYVSGIRTGMVLQLAIGPLFLVILSITLSSPFSNSLAAITGVTLVDFSYIGLALAGIGTVLQRENMKKRLTIVSALVLLIFGAIFVYHGWLQLSYESTSTSQHWTILSSFTTTMVMTASSPLTIIFFTSIFSLKAVEHGYTHKELLWFGIGTGSATFFFLTLTMAFFSLFRQQLSPLLLTIMNCAAGIVIIFYGIRQLMKHFFHPG